MSETAQTGADAGTASATTPSYEDQVDARYKACERQAALAVRADFAFRNARKELTKQCYLLFTTALSTSVIDASLRGKQDMPEEVNEVLDKHDLEPPARWSLNPALGVYNHFYYKARAEATEKGTAGGKEFPITHEEADDYISQSADKDEAKPFGFALSKDTKGIETDPTIAKDIAKGNADINKEAEWAQNSRYGRWLMQAVDMEHLGVKVFDMTMKEADREYDKWLKTEPFPDFLTQPIPSGFRKPSIARQPVAGASGRTAGRPRKTATATTTTPVAPAPAAAAAAASPAVSAVVQPADPATNPASADIAEMVGLAKPPRETDEERLLRKANEAEQGSDTEQVDEAEAVNEEVVQTETVEATSQTAPEASLGTPVATTYDALMGNAAYEDLPMPAGSSIVMPESAEAFQTDAKGDLHFADETTTQGSVLGTPAETEAAVEAVAEANAEAAEAQTWQATQPVVDAKPVEDKPVEDKAVAVEIVEPEIVVHEVIKVSAETFAALPAEGLLAYRKGADGELVITAGFLRHL